MGVSSQPSALRLAVSEGVLSPQLATLLALQRAEEPETPILATEVRQEDLIQGLEDGHYDLGIAISGPTSLTLESQLLWRDELAAAVPRRSPLLAHAAVPLTELLRYPMIQSYPRVCEALSQQIEALLAGDQTRVSCTSGSFELMALLVAAGYGVGIASRTRILQARDWGIVMRPLAEGAYWIGTSLLRPTSASRAAPAISRFARRARAVV